MSVIIRSGAFLQQCWSVHPLCVTVKRIAGERTLILTCSSCRFTHHLSIGMIAPADSIMTGRPTAVANDAGHVGGERLHQCVLAHPTAITLREMDVFQDLVRLRCADCRRQYEVTVSAFETHQR